MVSVSAKKVKKKFNACVPLIEKAIEKVASAAPATAMTAATNRKRSWSAISREDQVGGSRS
jgi:hypothetical protein